SQRLVEQPGADLFTGTISGSKPESRPRLPLFQSGTERAAVDVEQGGCFPAARNPCQDFDLRCHGLLSRCALYAICEPLELLVLTVSNDISILPPLLNLSRNFCRIFRRHNAARAIAAQRQRAEEFARI